MNQLGAQIIQRLDLMAQQIQGLQRLIASELPALQTMVSKACGRCGQPRTMNQYHVNRSSPDGKSSICRYCISEQKRAKREAA